MKNNTQLIENIFWSDIKALLNPYQLEPELVAGHTPIPGSYWGDPEAGLVGRRLYLRADTPVHSALHEACHYICMDSGRRERLHTDAGGGYGEENGVCYLQILLCEQLPGMGREQMLRDMDDWGYSFRLGSSRAWFEDDADDARHWLLKYGLIDSQERPTGKLRT